jgi:uncharacterized membrane protein
MEQVFSLVCGQHPEHTWAPGGEMLPFCERCTGFYVGAAIALALLFLFRPASGARYRWLHTMLVLWMAPFGFHLVSQDAILRTLSGLWFGFGIAGLLWLLPGERILVKRGRATRRGMVHALLGLTSFVLVPAIADQGGAAAHALLSWLALAGLSALAGLVIANALLLITGIFAQLRQRFGAAIP